MVLVSLNLKHLLSAAAKCNLSVDFKDARQFRWLKVWGKIGNFNFAKFHNFGSSVSDKIDYPEQT